MSSGGSRVKYLGGGKAGATLLFPPLPLRSTPLLPLPLPLEVGPLKPARGSGERCKLPHWGQAPAAKRFGAYVGQKEQLCWQQFYGFS